MRVFGGLKTILEVKNLEIGARIRTRRLELGLTQEELALKVGYKSRTSVNKIENGVEGTPLKMLLSIAAALNTTPQWLMGLSEEKSAKKVKVRKVLNPTKRKR